MKETNNLKTILIRCVVFVILLICISFFTGPYITRTRLSFDFYFDLYNNFGKIAIFFIIALCLLLKKEVLQINTTKYNFKNIVFIILGFLFIPLFFFLSNILLRNQSASQNIPLLFLTHIELLSIPVLLLIGVFGYTFIIAFVKRFTSQLLLCLILAIGFDLAINYIWGYWIYLSKTVLIAEYFLFSHVFTHVQIVPPLSIFVQTFTIKIAETCSGLESIFLFTALYIMILLSDIKKINLTKYLLLFPCMLLGLYLVNILRVFVLILIGVLINPYWTFQLFHTYIGMVFFIVYFMVFLKYCYVWLLNDKSY